MSKRIAIVFLAGLLLAHVLPAQLGTTCCVAGVYNGSQVPYPRPNCRPPKAQKFTMVVRQAKSCPAAVGGTVTDSSGVTSDWTGTLTPGLRGCCSFAGEFLTPSGNTVRFKGMFCKRLGKWTASGTWEEIKSSNPCNASGTWEMTQS